MITERENKGKDRDKDRELKDWRKMEMKRVDNRTSDSMIGTVNCEKMINLPFRLNGNNLKMQFGYNCNENC